MQQNAHSSVWPDAVLRDQQCGVPVNSLRALLVTVNEILKAEVDCFRHSV